jgi:hypothetical protein
MDMKYFLQNYIEQKTSQINESEELAEVTQKHLDQAMNIINARITKPGQPPRHPSYHKAPEDIKVAAKNLAKNLVKAQKESVELDEISMSLAKKVQKARDEKGDAFRTKAGIHGTDTSSGKHAMDMARKNWDKADKTKAIISRKIGEEVEELDEISKKTLGSYADKARAQRGAGKDREKGISMAVRKSTASAENPYDRGPRVRATEEVELDEISKSTLGSYIRKASQDMANNASNFHKKTELDGYKYQKYDRKKDARRTKGINLATDKLTKESFELSEDIHNDLSDAIFDFQKKLMRFPAKQLDPKVAAELKKLDQMLDTIRTGNLHSVRKGR